MITATQRLGNGYAPAPRGLSPCSFMECPPSTECVIVQDTGQGACMPIHRNTAGPGGDQRPIGPPTIDIYGGTPQTREEAVRERVTDLYPEYAGEIEIPMEGPFPPPTIQPHPLPGSRQPMQFTQWVPWILGGVLILVFMTTTRQRK